MSSGNPSAVLSPSPEKKRRYLSAEKKFQIYLEAQAGDKPVGELLRRLGGLKRFFCAWRRHSPGVIPKRFLNMLLKKLKC